MSATARRLQSLLRVCCRITAGLPASDKNWWCGNTTATRDSCYFYNETTASYASHKAACQGRGGYLVSWNSGK